MINCLLIRLRTVDMYRTYFKCLVIFTILQSFEILAAMQDYLLPSCNQSIECSIYTGNRSDKIEIEAFDDYPNLRILRVIGSNNLVNSKQLTTNLKTIYTNDYIYFYSYFTHKFIRYVFLKRPRPLLFAFGKSFKCKKKTSNEVTKLSRS